MRSRYYESSLWACRRVSPCHASFQHALRPAIEEGGDVFDRPAIHQGEVLAGHVADMRRQQDVVEPPQGVVRGQRLAAVDVDRGTADPDRKSTRLTSSH